MNVEAGQLIESRAFPVVTQDGLKAYAGASGDFNPIHLDEAVAKKAGLPGVIAHGMLIAAYLAERASQFVEERGLAGDYGLTQFQTRFRAMTHLGDTPSVAGSVKSLSAGEMVLELQARNQKGEVTTTGIARYRKTV